MKYSTRIRMILLSILVFSAAHAQRYPVTENKASCEHIKLQVLGAGGPEINDGLASSSYLVWIKGKARVMVDAGGGSSLNFEKSAADFNDLQVILLSHLHVDHSAALPVYIKAGYFKGRQTDLPVFGPVAGGGFPSTENFITALIGDKQNSVYPYLSDNYTRQPSTGFLVIAQSVKVAKGLWRKTINDAISIAAVSVHHGEIPALAWRVNAGACSVTFSGDMNGEFSNVPRLAQHTDLLVAHNAIPEGQTGVAKRLHMTPSKIGEIAQQAHVKKILLSHFMLRSINKKQETKRFIRKFYQGEILEAKELTLLGL